MKLHHIKAAFTGLTIAAVATACQSAGGYAPAANTQMVSSEGTQAMPDLLRASGLHVAMPNATVPTCTAPYAKLPGTFTIFVATGNVVGKRFTAVKAASFYVVEHLTKATPPPTPTPTTSPSPTTSPTTSPSPQPVYFYYGTYSLKTGTGGCAYLIATLDGKPLTGLTYNGETLGGPKIRALYYHAKYLAEGNLTLSVGGLSASGGSGTFALKNSAGGTYNSGAIDLVGRITLRF